MENINKPTAEEMAAWREKHGKIFTLEADEEINGETLFLVIKKPSRASFERYQEDAIKKGSKAMQQFAKENILYPDKEIISAIFSDKPGVAINIATNLQDLMGVSVNFTLNES